MQYIRELKLGRSRRKVESVTFKLFEIKGEGRNWTYRVIIEGAMSQDETQEANDAFDCLIMGMAYFRQFLRRYLSDNPKTKIYYEFESELEQLSVEDVFWTHDCITDEMDEMIDWAKENGFEPEQ